jgi:hypothetical protein
MVYLDFRSLSLTGALQRVGRGSGRCLFPCSRRFTPTEPHRRHAARRPGGRTGAWYHTAIDLRSLSLIGTMRPGGTRAEGGGRAQVGRGGERTGGEGGRGVKGDRDCISSFNIIVKYSFYSIV